MAQRRERPDTQPSPRRNWRAVDQAADEREFATVRMIRRLYYERRISHTKIGKRVFIDLDELDRYMAAHIVEAEG